MKNTSSVLVFAAATILATGAHAADSCTPVDNYSVPLMSFLNEKAADAVTRMLKGTSVRVFATGMDSARVSGTGISGPAGLLLNDLGKQLGFAWTQTGCTIFLNSTQAAPANAGAAPASTGAAPAAQTPLGSENIVMTIKSGESIPGALRRALQPIGWNLRWDAVNLDNDGADIPAISGDIEAVVTKLMNGLGRTERQLRAELYEDSKTVRVVGEK